MILLYNVYLDDKIREPGLYDRGLYKNYSSVDTFKYALASVVDIYPWKKVIINVVLNPTILNQKEDLFSYIKTLFCSYDLDLNDKRCEYQNDWKELYSKLDDNLIYFCCNHDHVFIDSDSNNFIKAVSEFRQEFADKEATLYFSHWPEVNNIFLNREDVITKETFSFSKDHNFDSIQIITKKVYHRWWFTGEFNHMFLPRTDYFTGTIPTQYDKFQAVPHREFFKHFDGYSHLPGIGHRTNLQSQVCNISPPLFIPPGFFNNDIKLRVGYKDNCEESININLEKQNYTVVDPDGTDLKCFLSETPQFWKSRISTVDLNPSYDETLYKKERDEGILFPLICGIFHGSFSNKNVLDKINKSYDIKK